jgi:hypothetical protein
VCGNPENDLRPLPELSDVRKRLGRLQLVCGFRNLGCEWQGDRDSFVNHVFVLCSNHPCPMRDSGCPWLGKKASVELHVQEDCACTMQQLDDAAAVAEEEAQEEVDQVEFRATQAAIQDEIDQAALRLVLIDFITVEVNVLILAFTRTQTHARTHSHTHTNSNYLHIYAHTIHVNT